MNNFPGNGSKAENQKMKTKSAILILAMFALTARAQDSTVKSAPVYSYSGVPSNGTSEIDTLTITGTGASGSFTLGVANGRNTGAITWSNTNATLLSNLDAALESLSVIGASGVTTAAGTLTSGTGTITLTFTGKNARQDFPGLSVTGTTAMIGDTITVSTTTAGVNATFRTAPTGTLLIDSVTPDLYINDSVTVGAPTWTKVSP